MQMSKRNFIKKFIFSSLLIGSSVGASQFLVMQNSAAKIFARKFDNSNNNKKKEKNMTFELPKLPYERNALDPYISEETINFHYGKHHQAYVTNLNKLVEGTDLASKSLEDVIKITADDESKVGIFNNAAQIWNHTFYWHSMKPNGGGKPNGKVLEKIENDFGSYENFVNEFKNAGATQFGSGWAWLVLDNNKLKITKTSNAKTPLTSNAKPLMTMDVWEHAYYLDYQNARPNYIDTFLEKLVNWDFVLQNMN
jgi:Fe-Mn family superoxide dismutase